MAFSIGLGCLPIIWSISLSSGPITGYVLAVYNGHVYPFIPAISDTGSKSPEASIFSMLMNVSISICVINLYVRYHQCDLQVKQCGGDIKDTLIRLNSTAVSFAAVSIVGAVIVANFQSSQNNVITGIHDTGAVILLTFGGFYFWIQTILSYLMRPYGVYSSRLCHVRLALTATISICTIAFFTASAYGYKKFVLNSHNHLIAQWRPRDGGYALHFAGNLCEWITLFAFVGLSLSFVGEFQEVSAQVKFKEKRSYITSTYEELNEYSTLRLNSLERNFQEEDHSELDD